MRYHHCITMFSYIRIILQTVLPPCANFLVLGGSRKECSNRYTSVVAFNFSVCSNLTYSHFYPVLFLHGTLSCIPSIRNLLAHSLHIDLEPFRTKSKARYRPSDVQLKLEERYRWQETLDVCIPLHHLHLALLALLALFPSHSSSTADRSQPCIFVIPGRDLREPLRDDAECGE